MSAAPGRPLLEVEDLVVHFPVTRGVVGRGSSATVKAVDGVSLTVRAGETLGLVGESGCGKSTTGRGILQLLRPTSGSVRFDGEELTTQWTRRLGRWGWSEGLRQLRRRMQIVFQDANASLNPRMTVEDIVGEPLETFGLASGSARRPRVQTLMEQVGLAPQHMGKYPHELSGGQRQRVGIARALALDPDLIVADEPVTALDVSVQAKILNLFMDLQRSRGLAYVFIAHDLSAVRHVSDRVAVMYLGRIVETAPVARLFSAPRHPYTKALIDAASTAPQAQGAARRRLVLAGDVPSPLSPPSGCPFHPRCPEAVERCATDVPRLRQDADGHGAACHLPAGGEIRR